MTKSKKQTKKGNTAMSIAGAIVGVGAAVAGAFLLKDKKNRDKVKKVFSKVKNKVSNNKTPKK